MTGNRTAEKLGVVFFGHSFKDKKLLQQALTHRSHGECNNERLEFLGDALLGMVIADALFQKFPNATEGELSRTRAALVRKDTLSRLAKSHNLGKLLIMGKGESSVGGREKASILADGVEALIGAVYLDADFAACKCFILDLYQDLFGKLDGPVRKDPKTALQEYLRSCKLDAPSYELLERIEHEKSKWQISVKCLVIMAKGDIISTFGKSRSKRMAEQAAADLMMRKLQSGM